MNQLDDELVFHILTLVDSLHSVLNFGATTKRNQELRYLFMHLRWKE